MLGVVTVISKLAPLLEKGFWLSRTVYNIYTSQDIVCR